MKTKVINFTFEKATKNTAKFEEQPEPGQPAIIGSLYVQKWFAGAAATARVTIELPEGEEKGS